MRTWGLAALCLAAACGQLETTPDEREPGASPEDGGTSGSEVPGGPGAAPDGAAGGPDAAGAGGFLRLVDFSAGKLIGAPSGADEASSFGLGAGLNAGDDWAAETSAHGATLTVRFAP